MSSKPPRRRSGTGGFTLIEVLVAFVIVALSLGALLQVFSSGLRSSATAEAYTVAALLAESKLAGIGIETPLEEGGDEGAFDNGFRWHSTITPYALGGETAAGSPLSAYEVSLKVSWGRSGSERSITLTTLRVAMESASP